MSSSDQWRRHTRIKLLLLVLVAVAPFAAFIAYMATEIRTKRIGEAQQRVAHLARIGVGAFDDTFRQTRHSLELMAREPQPSGGNPGCDGASALLARSDPWIEGLFVIDDAGIVRCSVVNPALVGIDLSGRPEIIAAFASDGFKVSNAFVAKARGVPLITATLPFISADGARWLLAITVDLSWFDRLSERIGEHNTVEVALVDGGGVLLSSYPKRAERVGTTISAVQEHLPSPGQGTGQKVGQNIGRRTGSQVGAFEAVGMQGAPAFVGVAHVPDTDLRLIVISDRAEALDSLRRGLNHAVILFGLVTLVMGGFIWIAGTKVFVGPMEQLADLLSGTLENMEQGVMVVDGTGRVPLCNGRAMALLDLPPSMMQSRPAIKDVIDFQEQRGDFRHMDRHAIRYVRPAGGDRTVYERETQDGRVLEIATVPFATCGVVRTYSDVTARKLQERRLAESEARYRLIAEYSSDMIAHCDLDFHWTYVSPAVERVLGYRAEEMLGICHDDLTHPDDLPARDEARRKLLATHQPVPVSKRMRHAHGHYVWLEAELCLTFQQGAPRGMLAIYRDVSARRAAEQALARSYEAMSSLAAVDALTGIANRRELDRRLEQEFMRARHSRRPLSLLMIDIDHYKLFNDTYGHVAGDECLKRFADLLAQHEQRPADLAARFGGEEFILLLPETDAASAGRVAELICAGIQSLGLRHETSPFGCVTVSIGIATASTSAPLSTEDLLLAADRALYAAKQGGRNRHVTAAHVERSELDVLAS